MLDLWLVRHGESLGNVDGTQADTSLSALGQRQARALRSALLDVHFDEVQTSPLVRAIETAKLALPGVAPTIESRLRELVIARECCRDQCCRVAGILLSATDDDVEHETGRQLIARTRDWLDDLPQSGRLIAFSHSGFVRNCLGLLLREQSVPRAVLHCSIFRIAVDGSAARLLAANVRDHLAGVE